MRKTIRISRVLGCVLAMLVFGATAQAGPAQNLGFETNDTAGWTLGPPGYFLVVGSHGVGYPAALSGQYMLRLTASCHTTTATQTVTLRAGRTISGLFAIDDHDTDRDDFLYVMVNGEQIKLYPGGFGPSPPIPWSFTAPVNGNYTIKLASVNTDDCLDPSHGLFDAVTTSLSASGLFPGLALRATLIDDATGLGLSGGHTIRFTCAGCTTTTATTNVDGVATIPATKNPTLFRSAVLAGGYTAEFYGDASANGSIAVGNLA